jgi:hypothetical protein
MDEQRIIHGDSPLRFLVPSRTVGGETYLVDLSGPTCQCRWFETSVAPALRRGEKPRKMCYHVLAAREHFTEWAIAAFSADQRKRENPSHAKTK